MTEVRYEGRRSQNKGLSLPNLFIAANIRAWPMLARLGGRAAWWRYLGTKSTTFISPCNSLQHLGLCRVQSIDIHIISYVWYESGLLSLLKSFTISRHHSRPTVLPETRFLTMAMNVLLATRLFPASCGTAVEFNSPWDLRRLCVPVVFFPDITIMIYHAIIKHHSSIIYNVLSYRFV